MVSHWKDQDVAAQDQVQPGWPFIHTISPGLRGG